MAELGPADCCVAAVASIPEVVDDDHFVARGTFRSARHPEAGEFRQAVPVLAGQERESRYEVRSADESDALELLSEVGVPGAEIESDAQGVLA